MSQGDLAHGNNNNAIYSSVHVKEYFKSVPKTFHRSTKQFIVLKLSEMRESEWGEEGKEGEERESDGGTYRKSGSREGIGQVKG